MKVRNLVPWSGDKFSYVPGDILDLPDDVAAVRIEAGLCEEEAPSPKSTSSAPTSQAAPVSNSGKK